MSRITCESAAQCAEIAAAQQALLGDAITAGLVVVVLAIAVTVLREWMTVGGRA
jgi:hypothetical protein